MADVFVGQVVQPIQIAERDANSKVVVRKYIQAAERKNQKHLGGPHADAFDLDQGLNHFFIRKPIQSFKLQAAIRNPSCQIEKVRCLLRRDPGFAQLWRAQSQEAFRRDLIRCQTFL